MPVYVKSTPLDVERDEQSIFSFPVIVYVIVALELLALDAARVITGAVVSTVT